jgi:predicted RNase H-like HicB family nuclease
MVGAPSLAEDVVPSYRISLARAGEGPDAAWLAEVDDLPNSAARGATPEEAVRRAWAAAERSLGLVRDGGGEGSQLKKTAQHSGKLLVRMPATLHDELARAAESEGVSLNQLITGVLAGAVEWGTADERTRLRGQASSAAGVGRVTRIALAANFAVVLVAAIAAITLLVVAWQQGW